jgi:hypothetical protein
MAAAMSGGWIGVEARVAAHAPAAMEDHFEDGSVALYDATVLELRSPPSLGGRSLTVFHYRPVEEGSLWQRVGAVVRFQLWEESLADDRQVFDGAVRDVELVDEEPASGGGTSSP